jgi:hypothetical protein
MLHYLIGLDSLKMEGKFSTECYIAADNQYQIFTEFVKFRVITAGDFWDTMQ